MYFILYRVILLFDLYNLDYREGLFLESTEKEKLHHEIISKKTFDEKIGLAQRITASLSEIEEMIIDIQKSKNNLIEYFKDYSGIK